MAEEVERLVLAQFREIVEKGKTAISNVESAGDEAPAPMLKAAQNLVREGERALKKIEPISTSAYDEYGINFINAIKENDDIAQFRSELETLLWDIDDYIDVAGFDADKFSELQGASKNAALRILDILRRMQLVAPTPVLISPPLSEVGPSMNGRVDSPVGSEARPGSGAWNSTDTSRRSLRISDPDGAILRHSRPLEPPSEPPPTPPSTDPWHVGRAVTTLGSHMEEEESYEHRSQVAPDSPTIPQTQLVSPVERSGGYLSPQELHDNVMREEQERRLRAASQSRASNNDGSMSPLHSHGWSTSTRGPGELPHSPSNSFSGRVRGSSTTQYPQGFEPALGRMPPGTSSPVDNLPLNPDDIGRARGNSLLNTISFPPRTTSVANQNSSSYTLSSRKPSTESINSSVFDVVEGFNTSGPTSPSTQRHSVRSTESTSTARYRPDGRPPDYPGYAPLYQIPPVPPRGTSSGARSSLVLRGMDDGLIPVECEGSASHEVHMPPRQPDRSITPSSSFYKLKGFCKGAEEAQHGQLGFKKIKRPVGGFTTITVAKCTHCLFEMDFRAVEEDVKNESSASHTSNTVGFRIRLLQKSHLPIRVIDEQMYGCLFCIQTGSTLEESDATVFFSQQQLLAHVARHPRPVPRVAGVTVVEDIEIPPQIKDNFDLHLPYPANESVMVGISREVSRLPAAVATATKRVSHGSIRLPPDRQPALRFAIGAKIVGIEFPPKYEGKWAIGWHDGVRAAFETDAVQLEAPSKAEVKMQGTSNVQAVARWKWNQKGDDRWLRFDKGDVIKNISWVYADHWCWSGTTSKGSGLFPQSHLEPDSLHRGGSGDEASVSSWEKKNPLKFSIRGKKEDRKLGSFSLGK